MTHEDFVSQFRAKRLPVSVDLDAAMHVRDSMLKSRSEALAHQMSKGCGCLLPFVGLVLSFIWHWWIVLVALFLSYVVTQATRKTAAQYVLESCLADEVFWRSMLDLGVIRFAESSDVG